MTPPTEQRRAILAACADMIRACGLTLAELAEHLGQPLQGPVVAPAGQNAPGSIPIGMTPRQAQALAHCDNPDGCSYDELEFLLGVSKQCACDHFKSLERCGHVIRVRAPGVRGTRYFTSALHAQKWVDSHTAAWIGGRAENRAAKAPKIKADKPKPAPAPAPLVAAPTPLVAAPPKPAAPAKTPKLVDLGHALKSTAQPPSRRLGQERAAAAGPVFTAGDSKVVKVAANAEVTYAPGFKGIQRAVTPAPRYSVQPGDALPGGFSSCPPGMNPATGKAWEARA